jgi:hypothetical protein
VCYKHGHAFLKVNKLFRRIEGHCNYPECLPSGLKKILTVGLSSLTTVDVIVTQRLCSNLYNVGGLFDAFLFF